MFIRSVKTAIFGVQSLHKRQWNVVFYSAACWWVLALIDSKTTVLFLIWFQTLLCENKSFEVS